MLRNNSKGRAYVAAVALTAIVFFLRLTADGLLGEKGIFLPFVFGIIGAAAFGGFFPGLFATLLSLLASSYFLGPSGQIQVVEMENVAQLFLLAFAGLLISIIGENFHRAKSHLKTQSDDLDNVRQTLEATESTRSMALEAGRMGTWEWLMATNRVTWAPSMGVVFGLSPDEFPSSFEAYLALVHPEDRERVAQNLRETVDSRRQLFDGRYRIHTPNGMVRWIATRGQAILSGEDVIGLRGVCWDITEEIEAEIIQARLAMIVSTSDDGIVSKDLSGTILTWNAGAEKIFGYSANEVVGQSIKILLPPERLEEEEEILTKVRTGQSIKNLETVRRHKDGSEITVSVTVSPIYDADRNIVALSKIVRDITKAREMERAKIAASEGLIERERRLSLATDTAELGVMEWDMATGAVRWENDQMYAIFGRSPEAGPYSYEELLERSVLPEERDSLRAEVATAFETSDSVRFRFRIRRENDGHIREIESRGTVIRTESGQPQKLVAVLSDITDKLTAEEQINIVLSQIDDHLVSYDSEWRYVYANDGACKVLGRGREELIGKCIWELYPDAIGNQYYEELHRAMENQETIRSEHYYAPLDRWFENHIYPSRRGVTVFASDITERKHFERALEENRALLATQQRQLQQLIDSIPVLISFVDAECRYQLVNRQYETWFNTPASQIVGRHMSEILGTRAYDAIAPYVSQALAGKEVSYEKDLPYEGAGARFVRAHYIPSTDLAGNINGFFVLVADHTEVHQRELDAQFIAKASSTLADMSDYKETLRKVAELAVPYFSDWCTVDILGDDGRLERLAVAHKDPGKVQLARELHERYPADPTRNQGAWRALRTGESELVSELTPEFIDAAVEDPEIRQIVRDLGLYSYICVPLVVAGKPIGAISYVSAEMKRSYGDSDLAKAEDLARRASVSIENALLYQQLQESDRRKDDFLATLAHELRNPLAPLRAGLDILARSANEPNSVNEVQQIMDRQLTQLVRLVDDLLDISRITTGKLELRKEFVCIKQIVDDAVEANRPLLEQRNHSLFVNPLSDLPALFVDPARITQVVQNLLNNAAKYTDPGGTVQVTIEHIDSELLLAVKDNGIGIDEDHLPYVFQMFSQVESALSRAHGGLGIGLSLVRGLVEMHGGSVEARSEGKGQGSEFIIRLPFESQTDGESTQDETVAEPGAKRVLVVDDNVDIAEMLGKMLRLVGNVVQTSNEGLDAIEKCRQFLPDVVLLDIGMPGMNGYEVARKLRQEPFGSGIKLIALTGWGSDEDKRQTREAGFDHHLVKPVQFADLAKIL